MKIFKVKLSSKSKVMLLNKSVQFEQNSQFNEQKKKCEGSDLFQWGDHYQLS